MNPQAEQSALQRLARAPYVLIRSTHILWLMAVMPLAFTSMSEQLHPLGGLLLGVLFFSGLVWTMMFMFFDLLTYPTTTLGALGASSTVFANCYFAWRGSDGDWSYAAYMTFLAFLAAFSVAFVFIVSWACYAGVRDIVLGFRASQENTLFGKLRALTRREESWPPALLLVVGLFYGGLAVSSVGFGVLFALPFVDRVLAVPSLPWRIAMLIAFATQAVWNLNPFYRFSVLGPDASARPDTDPEKQPWFTLQLLAMVFSVVILLFSTAAIHDPPRASDQIDYEE